ADQLALETGRDAEAERDRRAIEDACTHPKTRAIGKSRVLSCVRCGATRLPDAPPGPASRCCRACTRRVERKHRRRPSSSAVSRALAPTRVRPLPERFAIAMRTPTGAGGAIRDGGPPFVPLVERAPPPNLPRSGRSHRLWLQSAVLRGMPLRGDLGILHLKR